MKERPLLYTPENAQKSHVGTKTQTRRIVKFEDSGRVRRVGSYKNWHIDDPDAILACPYGDKGDRLWVREAWAKSTIYTNRLTYKGAYQGLPQTMKWKPGIHMPRWACRTVLEITEIRVQRVQEISEQDAMAEGCPTHVAEHTFRKCYRDPLERAIQRIESFQRLWESINGPGSWDANPWVWAITFQKVA